jgi:hypothetical protein
MLITLPIHTLFFFFFFFNQNSQKLKGQIELIQSQNLKELKTMVDLGSQFYAQAHM